MVNGHLPILWFALTCGDTHITTTWRPHSFWLPPHWEDQRNGFQTYQSCRELNFEPRCAREHTWAPTSPALGAPWSLRGGRGFSDKGKPFSASQYQLQRNRLQLEGLFFQRGWVNVNRRWHCWKLSCFLIRRQATPQTNEWCHMTVGTVNSTHPSSGTLWSLQNPTQIPVFLKSPLISLLGNVASHFGCP